MKAMAPNGQAAIVDMLHFRSLSLAIFLGVITLSLFVAAVGSIVDWELTSSLAILDKRLDDRMALYKSDQEYVRHALDQIERRLQEQEKR